MKLTEKFDSYFTSKSIKGIFFVIISLFLYSLSDTLIKVLLKGNSYGVEQTTWIRALTRTVPLFIMMYIQSQSFAPLKTQRPWVHFFNAVVGCARTFAFMYAFSMIPLAEASAFAYTSAIFFAILAVIFLKEKLHSFHVYAILIGAVGIVIGLYPGLAKIDSSIQYSSMDLIAGLITIDGSNVALVGGLITIGGAFLASVYKVVMRKLSFQDDSLAIVIYPNLFLLVVFAPFVIQNWQPVVFDDWLKFLAVGLTAGLGQYTFAIAVRLTTGLTLAPYDYTYFFWVLIMDFAFNGAIPSSWVMFGAIFIIGSNAIILFNEIKQARLSKNLAK